MKGSQPTVLDFQQADAVFATTQGRAIQDLVGPSEPFSVTLEKK